MIDVWNGHMLGLHDKLYLHSCFDEGSLREGKNNGDIERYALDREIVCLQKGFTDRKRIDKKKQSINLLILTDVLRIIAVTAVL